MAGEGGGEVAGKGREGGEERDGVEEGREGRWHGYGA